MNPYNISTPAEGAMFVGRSDVLEEIIDRGLKDSGMPSIVIAGRRLGKTSLLFQIAELLRENPKASDGTWIIPVYLDLKEIEQLDPSGGFWRTLVDKTIQTLHNMPDLDYKNVEAQISQDDTNDFHGFTLHLNMLIDTITSQLGKVRIVFLIDEMEEMLGQEWTDSALSNLRWLHNASPTRGSVSFVLTGFKDLHTYKEEVGSPLANIALMQPLSVLSYEESVELMTKPLKVPPTKIVQDEIYRQSGGHPFLIQYLMWRICHNNPVVATKDDVEEAIDFFYNQRGDFQNWWESLSEVEEQVYALLSSNERDMSRKDICAELRIDRKEAGDALNSLCYLGIAKQPERNHFWVSSLMFRDWAEDEGLMADLVDRQTEVDVFFKKSGVSIDANSDGDLELTAGGILPESLFPIPICVSLSEAPTERHVDLLAERTTTLHEDRKNRLAFLISNSSPDYIGKNRMGYHRTTDNVVVIPMSLEVMRTAIVRGAESCVAMLDEYYKRYKGSPDLFDDRNAIVDTYLFFGREGLLNSLQEELDRQEGIGIFGLRKSGKTSLMFQLRMVLKHVPVSYVNYYLSQRNPKRNLKNISGKLKNSIGSSERCGGYVNDA